MQLVDQLDPREACSNSDYMMLFAYPSLDFGGRPKVVSSTFCVPDVSDGGEGGINAQLQMRTSLASRRRGR